MDTAMDDRFAQVEKQLLAYQTFRRGLRRLEDAKDEIRRAVALLERANHPLGPVTQERVNETTAERLGFTPAQVALLERQFCDDDGCGQ
jgi:hypothetical protein